MTPALPLLVLALGVTPPGKPSTPVVKEEGAASETAPARLATAEDVTKLCKSLDPAERLRAKGDAVERGEAEARHDAERDAALAARYEVIAEAARIPFAPYDGPERLLSLAEPVQIPFAGGAARLWPTEQRGLAVGADAAVARRVLDAQRAGTLSLAVVFDLPDDGTCGAGDRGKKFTIPIEPVSWRWLDGEVTLAAGGAAAERPLLTLAAGAKPTVDVGEPLAGPAELKKAVAARSSELEACYAEALERDPVLDGVLVADVAGAKPVISADSVGDAQLSACVQRVLGPLAPAHGGRGAVPIRFELVAPGAAQGK
jgi:hypothetical protein